MESGAKNEFILVQRSLKSVHARGVQKACGNAYYKKLMCDCLENSDKKNKCVYVQYRCNHCRPNYMVHSPRLVESVNAEGQQYSLASGR